MHSNSMCEKTVNLHKNVSSNWGLDFEDLTTARVKNKKLSRVLMAALNSIETNVLDPGNC